MGGILVAHDSSFMPDLLVSSQNSFIKFSSSHVHMQLDNLLLTCTHVIRILIQFQCAGLWLLSVCQICVHCASNLTVLLQVLPFPSFHSSFPYFCLPILHSPSFFLWSSPIIFLFFVLSSSNPIAGVAQSV